jgi:peptide deformylase
MILPIVTYGNPILRKPGHRIKEMTPELDELIDNMFQTMYAADGVGLTAHQVDRPLSLFVVDYNNEGNENLKEVFINPEIVNSSTEEEYFVEACLSVPRLKEEVSRPTSITIRYLDREFNEKEVVYEGVLARIIQHEYDHSRGVLFVDHLAPIKKRLLSSKLQQIQKKKFAVPYRVK